VNKLNKNNLAEIESRLKSVQKNIDKKTKFFEQKRF